MDNFAIRPQKFHFLPYILRTILILFLNFGNLSKKQVAQQKTEPLYLSRYAKGARLGTFLPFSSPHMQNIRLAWRF